MVALDIHCRCKGGGGRNNLVCYSTNKFILFNAESDKKINGIFNTQLMVHVFSLSNDHDDKYIETNLYSICCMMLLTSYKGPRLIVRFFKQAWKCT